MKSLATPTLLLWCGCILPGLLVPPPSMAQSLPEAPELPARLDLVQAIELADQHNPLLNEARERLVEQDGRLITSKSSRLPQIGVFGLYQWEDADRSGSFGGGEPPDEEFWRAGVDVTQPLYAGGRLHAAVAASREDTKALQADVRAAQAQVMANVHRNFYAALLAREVVAVQKESIRLLQEQLSLAQNRFEAGAGARFDVLQAEVRLANAQPSLIRAENSLRNALDRLRTSFGAVYSPAHGPDAIEIVGTLAKTAPLMDREAALAEAWEQRSELIALTHRTEAARQNLRHAEALRTPTLDAFANYAFEHDRYAADDDLLQGWQAGVQARWSVWEGGRIRGAIKQAASRVDQASLREQAARLEIEREVRTAWNNAHEAQEILDAAERVIEQAEEALRLAGNRYSVGAVTQLDVLSAQLELTQARLNRITAVHDYNLGLVELERAIGRVPGLSVEPVK